MSRVFLSHSSRDNRQAVAVKAVADRAGTGPGLAEAGQVARTRLLDVAAEQPGPTILVLPVDQVEEPGLPDEGQRDTLATICATRGIGRTTLYR